MSSKNRRFELQITADGNLIILNIETKGLVWTSGSYNPNGVPNYRLVMQEDNNLVLYDSENHPLWLSGTHNHGSIGAFCDISNDGQLVIYDGSSRMIWSS
eukprot:NODE_10772_length_492_cov_15.747967_g10120_i0.p1 GENE.NODE_10772_length_492_cov_15.747967_g10120_i0~~NODE_10772_length_492_cov_15.747967_g10120_i0.p1  ORF type:complete len:116 (-),score=17.30 NODE_10772_length_492_cov_15.747967_g10120_i0:143-442(-)